MLCCAWALSMELPLVPRTWPAFHWPPRISRPLTRSPYWNWYGAPPGPKATPFKGPAVINRESLERRVLVEVNVRGRDLVSYVREAQARVQAEVELPAGVHLEWGGQFENFSRASRRLGLVVPMALAIIFGMLFLMFGDMRYAVAVEDAQSFRFGDQGVRAPPTQARQSEWDSSSARWLRAKEVPAWPLMCSLAPQRFRR